MSRLIPGSFVHPLTFILTLPITTLQLLKMWLQKLVELTLMVAILWMAVESRSCAEVDLCCSGHNMTCMNHRGGPGRADRCYCDEVCLEFGDCCGDYLATCLLQGNTLSSLH